MSWIDYWVDHYPVNADTEVLNEVGARVRERGHHDRQDFITGPRTVKARLTVYLTALLAKQITAFAWAIWPLLAGRHPGALVSASPSLTTFTLVRCWVPLGGRNRYVPRPQDTQRPLPRFEPERCCSMCRMWCHL